MALPSSSSYARIMYDVFVSFRGEDTRKSIIHDLYYELRQAGFHVFQDEVDKLQSIQEARISIIVFSKTYAKSRRCLDELATIMECKQRLNQLVYPVFYGVDPLEVRHQTGEFGYALAEHQKRFEYGKVNRWRVSLTAAANLSGWNLQTMSDRFEPKVIEGITNDVLRALNFVPMNFAKYPIGIDSHVKDILHLLQNKTSDGVKMIGIFGISGIGKSTLAQAIYNHLISFQRFEGKCFVANISSKVSMKHLVHLQEKLLRKTLSTKKFGIDNVERGKVLIKEALQSKRVLIVLDDVDHISQLESLVGQRDWFGWGSVVIITTRNVNLLRGGDLIKAHEKYEVGTLSSDESLQLLSLHAFSVLVPPEEYTELFKRIVGYTHGIPLTLTVLGSFLRGKSVEEWINDVEKLGLKEEWSNNEAEKLGLKTLDVVQKIHRKSYDELDDDTQTIFLNIARFFIGLDKNDIVQDFGIQFETGIRTLIERGLLTIHRSKEKEKLQMHSLVWEMAIEMIRNEFPQDPSKRSRLMDRYDVYDVIKGNKGTGAIKGMYVRSSMLKNTSLWPHGWFLDDKLWVNTHDRAPVTALWELHPMWWAPCEHQALVLPPNGSHFDPWGERILPFVSKNESLHTKVLSGMKDLRLLKLDGVHLKGSYKHLPKELGWFWWHNCPLENTPSDFHPEKLEVLRLDGSNIKSVQLKMQHFKRLRILDLGGCEQLEKAPIFTGAQSLQILSFKYCKNLVKLSSSIGCLESLIELDLAFCQKLKTLPNSISQLKSLKFLYLNDCSSLEKVPLELGKLGQLRKLLVHNTNISFLPTSLGDLTKLKILSVGWPKDLLPPPSRSKSQSFDISVIDSFFPPKFGDFLCSLEALYITDNHLRDKELLDFKRLSSLKVLSLKGSYYLQSFPFGLSCLSRLESLELDECPNLNQLLQLPPSLLKLSAKSCASLRKIDISTLEKLKELYIPNCKSLIELPGLESLDSIQRLDITNCSALTIPLIESCSYQAVSEGGGVEIWLQMVGSFVYCTIPSLLRHKFFDIIHGGFDPNYTCEACIIVRSRATGGFIVKKVKHVDCRCLEEHRHLLTLHFRLEDDIVINTSERFHFKVQMKVGEELEVYAVFQPLKIFSLCVLHRNSDGEVRFFPSTRGFIEFVEVAESTERDHHMVEEVGNSSFREKEARVQIHEITEDDSPSREEQKKLPQAQIWPKALMPPPPPVPPRCCREKKGPSPRVPAVSKKPRMDENNNNNNTRSEQIQKLHDEATRLVAEESKLKRGILEFLDVALLGSKEEATTSTPELSALLNMLKVQTKGGSLEMALCLLEALKNYEVERRLYQNDTTTGSGVVDEMEESDPVSGGSSIVEEEHSVHPLQSDNTVVSSRIKRLPEKLKGIDYDKVLELFFTPKKFEGLVVVKLGEAIEVTGTGMYSLKPGQMIQDDVINSHEFLLRERAGSQPKCWYLPTYICQESNYFCDMYERNFKPYVTKSSCDIIFLPIFLSGHWYLVQANTRWRQGLILDSFNVPNQRQAKLEEAIKVMRVLHNLLKDHTLRDPTYRYEADFEDWEFVTAKWVPQQGNGVDCGAFVMLFMEMADQLSKQTVFDIDMERRRIALQLLCHPRNNARLSLVLQNLQTK